MPRKTKHEVETTSADQMLAQEETPTTDLDLESLQTDEGVRQPQQDVPAGTGAPTSAKDQLIEACRRAVAIIEPLGTHPDTVDLLNAALARAEKAPRAKREGPTKESAMIDMLKLPAGCTVAQLMEALGWQRHSVFGAMATLRHRRGLVINSEKPEGGVRTYRLA